MTHEPTPGHGYHVAPQEIAAQIAAIAAIGDQTNGLAAAAGRLAERLPMLGTAPPAIHLAMRLRAEAGRSGLTGEVSAAGAELTNCHHALKATVAGYLEAETATVATLRTVDGAAT